MKGLIKAEEPEQAEARRRVQVLELRRLATRILEWLDQERGKQESEEVPQPLHVLLLRHFDGSRLELKLLQEGVSDSVKDERNQSVWAQHFLCAGIGLACALDAAQLDPSEARSALEASPFAGEDTLAVLLEQRHTELVDFVLSAAPYLNGIHELDATAAALQNRYEMEARHASVPVIRAWNEGAAQALAAFKAITAQARTVGTDLLIASSLKPDVRRKLGVAPLIGLPTSEFDRAVNLLLLRLRRGKLSSGVLSKIAYGGVSNPPTDLERSLEKRLDRVEEQWRAPEKR
jgi:hypothetical protein